MEYILIIIGLILIYLSLRFEIKKNRDGGFKSTLSKNLENNELDRFNKNIEYTTLRLDNIENEITILDNKISFLENELIKASYNTENEINAVNEDENEKIPIEIEKTNIEIYKLYDSGKSIEEISSILRLGKGEVSLRLGLRK